MTYPLHKIECFLSKARKDHIVITLLDERRFKAWFESQGDVVKNIVETAGFKGQSGKTILVHNEKGALDAVLAGIGDDCRLYDSSAIVGFLQKSLSNEALKKYSFEFKGAKTIELERLYLGWALGAYGFGKYKKADKSAPALVWSQKVEKARINAIAESVYMLRDLVNTPTIDMGPADLEAAAKAVADKFKAKFKVTKGKALETGFPLVHAVGMAGGKNREPRLIEFSWGKAKDPALTIVGKGVCFDTGGLDLKPSQYMKLMKKDMGGAAHALGLARIIMAMKLPVNLRVIIPAVENAVAGDSFRPGDIFKSRSGKTVENKDTDAEGRLILADALYYASEAKPDLIVDFATLTGSARAALGPDIPAVFTNEKKLEAPLQKQSWDIDDPLWPMPLVDDYKSLLESDIADLHNHVGQPGDLIYSALFLQNFVAHDCRWIHVDCYAWENNGRPGRPKGGKDTGMRAMFSVLESLYRS
jgi:leucyl aminopeptidase